MLDAWRNRTRDGLLPAEKLLALPEQEFVLWALGRALQSHRAAAPLVCIWGEPGSGKSTLVRQSLRQQSDFRRRRDVIAEAAEWSAFLAERAEQGDPPLTAKDVEVVVCDALQNLSDPRGDGDRLAGWIDQLQSDGIPVIVTTDRLPSQIPELSPRLLNRLHGGLLAGIRPLSEASQQRLLQLWSSPGSQAAVLSVPPAITTAGQLKEFSSQRQRQPTNAPSEIGDGPAILSLEAIAEAVAHDFQVPLSELCSGARTGHLKIPRCVAMFLARELTPNPLIAIGRHFGCRSHTSVVRSCSRLQELLPDAPSLRQQLQTLRAKLRDELSADCG